MEIKRAGSQASAKGEEVPLFRRLSDNFELCVTALNLLRCDSDEFFVEGMTWKERSRAVRKYVGDCALFMAGLFPEKIAHRRSRKNPQLEALVDFVEVGKESYSIVSTFDQFEYLPSRRPATPFPSGSISLVKWDVKWINRIAPRTWLQHTIRLSSSRDILRWF